MPAILAKKLGMTQRFLDDGRVERVTVLEAGPCPVTAIRTHDADGYEAVQLGFGTVREKALNKPKLGYLKKVNASPVRKLVEFRDEAGELVVGDTVTVEAFEVGQKVKIAGTGKGKGFQGTIKRHHFTMGDATHGNSLSHRSPGSIGQRQTPGRVFPGKKMAGHMGAENQTTQRLQVVKVDAERGLIAVRGAVPGAPGGDVIVRPSSKA
jgi:large subunit ribosomal protein L3